MPLPPESFFEGTPPHVRAYLQQLQATIANLQNRLAELEAQRTKNSTHSSLPPSSEHPHAKPLRPTPKSPRRSGGQPGPTKHQRPLLATEQCQHVIPGVPTTCRRCAAPLSGTDTQPLRHQVGELPEIKPSVTEYQRHRLTCRGGTLTWGALPPGVPTGQAGPRLIAFSGLLMSCFRQSKRRAALFLSMILNQPARPSYRAKFADNLKRELPRIPFAADFRAFAAAGEELVRLHLDYEKLEPYPLKWLETPGVPLSYRVEDKMRLSKDKTAVTVNPSLTLAGIPPESFSYRLGNRSALDWVIDQYYLGTKENPVGRAS